MNKTVVIGGPRSGDVVEWTFDYDKVDDLFYQKVDIIVGEVSGYIYKLASMSDKDVLDELLSNYAM